MSQQGEKPTRRPAQEDDWWGQLYEDAAAGDTGPAPTADTLDDRFASAGAVTAPPGPVPAPRAPDGLSRLPWEGVPGAPGTAEIRASKPSEPDPEPDPEPAAPEAPASLTVSYVGDGPPTYDAEPTALPPADPDELEGLVADTVLDGAHYGSSTLRAASVRGDSARYRGEPRRDSLLTARFGSGPGALILVAMATGARATPGAHRAAAEACDWIGRAVGLSYARLAEDIRAGRRGDLKSGLHRLTDRSLGKLRAGAAERGLDPGEYAAGLRCLLVPADPECRTRVFFGVGGGGLFRLRDGEWQDIEPSVGEQSGAPLMSYGSLPAAETPDGDRLTMDLGITTPPSPYEPAPEPPRDPFRFRASVARPGDTLLLCTAGLAEPLRGEPDLCRHLARRWAGAEPPGLAMFLADTQVRVKGYADDRTAAAVWEA
ncbi:protein phosphatase 2C domain-containing protein [Streptomyces sp. NPDC102467]|uniref:protein phosphatase 2C domain-containing protein n=1 Tax=Streptomyces sp. NPDC102467 TaxID=3366179 RepID=UPI0037F9AE60